MLLNIDFPPHSDRNGFCRPQPFFNIIESVFAARKLSINLVTFAHWQHLLFVNLASTAPLQSRYMGTGGAISFLF
jgi:hypothetical protein